MKKCNSKGCEAWDCDSCRQTACCDKRIICDCCSEELYEDDYHVDNGDYCRDCAKAIILATPKYLTQFLVDYTDNSLNLEKDFYINYMFNGSYTEGACENFTQEILDICKKKFNKMLDIPQVRERYINNLLEYCSACDEFESFIEDFKELI